MSERGGGGGGGVSVVVGVFVALFASCLHRLLVFRPQLSHDQVQ